MGGNLGAIVWSSVMKSVSQSQIGMRVIGVVVLGVSAFVLFMNVQGISIMGKYKYPTTSDVANTAERSNIEDTAGDTRAHLMVSTPRRVGPAGLRLDLMAVEQSEGVDSSSVARAMYPRAAHAALHHRRSMDSTSISRALFPGGQAWVRTIALTVQESPNKHLHRSASRWR